MKKVFTFLVAVLLTATLWAQSPEKMSYQAVIRNTNDALVTNTQIGIEINIRQGSQAGTVVYTETQTPTTNENGLVSIEIGGGVEFSTIDWANGSYYIETKIAVLPPLTTYTIVGASQLLSVPYALHAKTSAQAGLDGQSAYQIAVTNGFVGTEAEWLTSLEGTNGTNGTNGNDGAAGQSAYQIAVTNGFVGTEAEWLTSLEGTNGTNGNDGTNGTNGTNGNDGAAGQSAYQLALTNGFVGTEAEWLTSLEGTNGNDGAAGQSAYQIAVTNGFVGTEAEWLTSLEGATGTAGADGLTTSVNGVTHVAGEITLTTANIPASTDKNYITDAEQTKLTGIATGAEVNVQADWNQSTTTADDYIKNKPTIINSQWTTSGSGIYYNTGKVSVGTTNSTFPLEVSVPSTSGSQFNLKLTNLTLGIGNGVGMLFAPDDAAIAKMGIFVERRAPWGLSTMHFLSRTSQDYASADLSNSVMSITSNGYVGMGTTTPSVRLDVVGVINATGGNSTNWNTAYGWSNHATAGYLTSETQNLSNVLTLGTDAGNKSIVNILQQGIGTATPDASAALDISSTTKGFLPPRLTTLQINTIASPATGLIVFNTSINKPQFFDGTGWKNFDGTHYIGENYEGDIIFYIDGTGEHGLACAPSDQSTGIVWYSSYVTTSATGTAVGTGQTNTNAIVGTIGAGSYAAQLCNDLDLNGHTDWFFPSKDELNLLYINLHQAGLGNFGGTVYWSSSETGSAPAWRQNFSTGTQFTYDKPNTAYIRAIRAF